MSIARDPVRILLIGTGISAVIVLLGLLFLDQQQVGANIGLGIAWTLALIMEIFTVALALLILVFRLIERWGDQRHAKGTRSNRGGSTSA